MVAKEKEAIKKAKQAVVGNSQRRQPSPYHQPQQHFNQQLRTLTEAIEGSHSPSSRGGAMGELNIHHTGGEAEVEGEEGGDSDDMLMNDLTVASKEMCEY
jgi:hypothetical protein